MHQLHKLTETAEDRRLVLARLLELIVQQTDGFKAEAMRDGIMEMISAANNKADSRGILLEGLQNCSDGLVAAALSSCIAGLIQRTKRKKRLGRSCWGSWVMK